MGFSGDYDYGSIVHILVTRVTENVSTLTSGMITQAATSLVVWSIILNYASVSVFLKISSDVFKDCRCPSFFAVGSESGLSSVTYTEASLASLLLINKLLISLLP